MQLPLRADRETNERERERERELTDVRCLGERAERRENRDAIVLLHLRLRRIVLPRERCYLRRVRKR